MLVREIMTRQVVAIGPEMPIGDVHALMAQRNIRHFPILGPPDDEGNAELVGIVSDRDIRVVGGEHPDAKAGVTLKSPVREIMVAPVLTAHPLDPIEEAAKTLRERKIGAMPVVEDGRLVGIATALDFLDALVRMTGVHGAACRLEVEVGNRPGALAGLLDRIARRQHNVSSVLTTRQEADSITFVLRVDTIDVRELADALEEAGYGVLWPPRKSALA